MILAVVPELRLVNKNVRSVEAVQEGPVGQDVGLVPTPPLMNLVTSLLGVMPKKQKQSKKGGVGQ